MLSVRLKLFCSNHFEKVFHSCLESNKSGWSCNTDVVHCPLRSGFEARPHMDSAVKEEVTPCWIGKLFCWNEVAAGNAFLPLLFNHEGELVTLGNRKIRCWQNKTKFVLSMWGVELPFLTVCLVCLKQPDFVWVPLCWGFWLQVQWGWGWERCCCYLCLVGVPCLLCPGEKYPRWELGQGSLSPAHLLMCAGHLEGWLHPAGDIPWRCHLWAFLLLSGRVRHASARATSLIVGIMPTMHQREGRRADDFNT